MFLMFFMFLLFDTKHVFLCFFILTPTFFTSMHQNDRPLVTTLDAGM